MRSVQCDPPRVASYVAIGLALVSHIVALVAGTSLPGGLTLSLIVSALLDVGEGAREQLPEGWNRRNGIFTIGALLGSEMLTLSGPSWIG